METDVLIVGAGPAGAMAALLLSQYGVRTLLINKYSSASPGPRSHIVNQRTMEVLREVGLEEAAVAAATPQELLGDHVYATSLLGEELGRIRAWGSTPAHKAAHLVASPCAMCDLPQLYFEPIVLQAASLAGAQIRFQTEYLSHQQDEKGVLTTLKDRLTGAVYTVRSAYLLGADGARSKVAQDIGLTYEGEMGLTGAGSINVEFTADLSPWVEHRAGDMYWFIQPGLGIRGQGIGSLRMVRPWHKWVGVWGYDLAEGPPAMNEAEARRIVHRLLGDDTIPLQIDAWSTWTINRRYAHRLSQGRVFCLGDAIHSHSPMGGLGLNTSVQDAYNLSWKLAWVLQGKAGSGLLATYDPERAPIARQIVEYAYGCGRYVADMFHSMGLGRDPAPEALASSLHQLKAATPEGAAMRAGLRQAMDATLAGFGGGHGIEMNQRYTSTAIFGDEEHNSGCEVSRVGTPGPGMQSTSLQSTNLPSTSMQSSVGELSRLESSSSGVAASEQFHEPTTRPGAPMPHGWLTRAQHRISTLDVCGRGRFVLFTGLSGYSWRAAAQAAAAALGIELSVHVIGPGEELEDSYGDFARLSEIPENGALLVRPDRFIAWRTAGDSAAEQAQLTTVLRTLLH